MKSDSMKKLEKFFTCLGTFFLIAIFGVAIWVFIKAINFLSIESTPKAYDHSMLIGTGIIVAMIILGVVCLILAQYVIKPRRLKKISAVRVEFIDYFYFMYNAIIGPGTDLKFKGYYIVKDLATNELYSIVASSVSYNNRGMEFVRSINGRRENNKLHAYGNLWIDNENKKIFKRDEYLIYLHSFKTIYYKNKNIAVGKKYNDAEILENLNDKYDDSILDKVKFIDGLLEFDHKE